MVFAKNAIYCASGNYSFNGLTGMAVSGNVFEPLPSAISAGNNAEGRSESMDFIDHSQRNVYPTTDSALLSVGDPAFKPQDDFNGTGRSSVTDARAYAWTEATNPGWAIAPRFKNAAAARQTMTINAGPTSVAYKGQCTLAGDTQNASSYQTTGAWSGAKTTSRNESTGALTLNSTYQIEGNGSGGTTSRSVDIQVQVGSFGGDNRGNAAPISGGGNWLWLHPAMTGAIVLKNSRVRCRRIAAIIAYG